MYFPAFLERFALLLIAMGVASHAALAVDITGAGATFPYPIYAKWADHVFVEERTVDVHIRRLRQALEPTEHDSLVETVRGTGYRFRRTLA